MSQFILDCFPDFVSEYGLIGCGLFSLSIVWVIAAFRLALQSRA